MRLCAFAQPAYMRMTRRRSARPPPSTPAPREDNDNRCSELNGNGNGNDPLDRLDRGRSI
jgi:hypothetical protein